MMLEPIDIPIRHSTYIDVPPERVFATLISAEGWDGWFTSGMELDPQPGGVIRFVWREWGPDKINSEDHGHVIAVEAPRRFVFTWHTDTFLDPTQVSFTLVPQGAGTAVTVEDSGYPDTEDGRRWHMDCATGWGEALTLLKFYLEKGLSYRRPD